MEFTTFLAVQEVQSTGPPVYNIPESSPSWSSSSSTTSQVSAGMRYASCSGLPHRDERFRMVAVQKLQHFGATAARLASRSRACRRTLAQHTALVTSIEVVNNCLDRPI